MSILYEGMNELREEYKSRIAVRAAKAWEEAKGVPGDEIDYEIDFAIGRIVEDAAWGEDDVRFVLLGTDSLAKAIKSLKDIPDAPLRPKDMAWESMSMDIQRAVRRLRSGKP